MSDMSVNHAVPAAAQMPSVSAQGISSSSSAPASRPSADVLDLSDIGLGKITRYGNDSPLSSQILGYGGAKVERTDNTQHCFGNMTQHYTVHCDWTYVDLVNHTITRTVSHGEGINYSDSASGTRVSAFAGVTASVTFSAERYFSGQLDDVAGALTASREVMTQQLKNTLHGSELEDGLKKFEDIYSQSRERAASSFADMLMRFADRDSKSELIDKARESVRSVFTACEERFAALSAGLEFGAGADLYALTAQLRHLSASGFEHSSENGLYSLRELDFAAVSVSAWRGMVSSASRGGGGSEARQALAVSFTAMKLELMAARGFIGGEMSGFLRSGLGNVRERLLGAMDSCLALRRENGGGEDVYPAADSDLYDSVYGSAMDAFGMSGDAVSALREGASTARAQLSASRLTAARFSAEISAGGYWDSFSGRGYRSGLYSYAAEWQGFTSQLSAGSMSARA